MPLGSHVPAVSVVLPFRNPGATLVRAIESIRVQDFVDWELILVDNASTDRSLERSAAAAADDRIRVVTEPRAGIVPALKTGLAAARAPLIARMDADDVAAPERLGEQTRFLRSHPEVGLCATRVRFAGDRAVARGYALYVDWTNDLLTHSDIALNRFVESPIAHPSVCFRTACVERFGGYRDGPFPEDYELWLRWLEAGVRMEKLPDFLLEWHDPPSRISRSDPRYASEAFFAVKSPYLARFVVARQGSRPLWQWGAGRETRRRTRCFVEAGMTVAAYVDVDPKRIGQSIAGIPVYAPEAIPTAGEVYVIACVAVRGARERIRRLLAGRGYEEGTDFVCAG